MDNNRDRRTEGNDILKAALEATENDREFFDYENETIIFRKAYKQGKSDSNDDKSEMQHTAQIRGGAVVRPLKQSVTPPIKTSSAESTESTVKRPAPRTAANTVSPTPTKSAPKSVSPRQSVPAPAPSHPRTSAPALPGGARTTSVQPQNRHIVPAESRNTMANKQMANKNVQPISQAKPLAIPQTTPKTAASPKVVQSIPIPTVPPKSASAPTPKSVVQPVPDVPKNTAVSVNASLAQGAPVSNRSGEQRTVNVTSGGGRIIKPTRPESPKPSNTVTPVSHHVRSENDDFEIDEATYNGSWKRSKKDLSSAGESASGAVMSLVKAMVYIVAVIAISVGLSVFVIDTANDVFKFVVEEKIVSVSVPDDATIDDVADILYDAGAIKHKWAFKLWSNMKDADAEFIPGDYEVSTTLNYDYLRSAFKKSNIKKEVRITIPEGFTVDEIIDRFVENGIGTREGFVDVINNYEFDYPFLENLITREGRIYRLEGYLFPDTYYFYDDSSEVTVINKLLSNFNRKFISEYYARCSELGLSVDDAIILASMVEKETRYADELGNVSSVFHNRLRYSGSFPYLNSDATIMYAMAHDLGGRPDTMGGEDTEYDTPYNTYTYKGLPPGPIANPSLNAIKYALYPNDTDYFYFVSDSSGRTLFAKTEPEHLQNIATVRGN